ncbi:hypothetical protein ACFU98_37490 [Streptomyces sp. NPDC057575]|uniref:hypothetical protein n=1 Tax=unclassified Streptomyces TaxID=2593676 RepID=UPI00369E1C58
MEDTQMPEPLRQAVHQLVSEVVMNCQEVLRYTEPDIARDWKRMTLIRATDASDNGRTGTPSDHRVSRLRDHRNCARPTTRAGPTTNPREF